MDNKVQFSVELANEILATLGTMPFNNVNQLMGKIQTELSTGKKQVIQEPPKKEL